MENDVNKQFKIEEDIIGKILDYSNGTNAKGEPKSAINISCIMYDDATEQTREISNISIFNPTTKIERHGEYIQLDLCFSKAMDNDLRSIWAIFESYGKLLDKFDEDTSEEIPLLNVVVVPVELSGKYYISLNCPIFWILQPETPGSQYNIIRILFKEDNIDFMESDEIDFEEIEKEVKVEEAQTELTAAMIYEKEKEQEEYEKRRAELFDEMRKNPKKFN